MRYNKKIQPRRLIRAIAAAVAAVLGAVYTCQIMVQVASGSGTAGGSDSASGTNTAIMDRYDAYVTNHLSTALEGVVVIEKEYWLSDEDMIAPEPNQSCFGETDDPSTLGWLLEEAERLLGISDTLFTTDVQIIEGSKVKYYLDETIFVVCWQQVLNNTTYSMSEVRIAHPSQFRRFLADGTYGSEKEYVTTEMAATVNAVVASAGDFYKFRNLGTVVHNGVAYRANNYLDTCFIDENGDMIFTTSGTFTDVEDAQRFVDEHDVRFSLSFGPILVDDYQKATPRSYPIGMVNEMYTRSALAQMGQLHYLLVVATLRGDTAPTISTFADQLVAFGCQKAYALDGGQTATIVFNDALFNRPDYGTQRKISDIIYFATAIPSQD